MYTPITNAEIDADSFWTETTSFKVRDNIEGHNHSEATTTDVVNAGLQAYTAGDYLLMANDTERTTSSTTYVKVKEIKIVRAGGYRVKFDLRSYVVGTAYGQIYKNGSAVGTERSTTSDTDVNFSEDLTSFLSGDLIQIYAKQQLGNPAYVNDFRIYCAEEGGLSGY